MDTSGIREEMRYLSDLEILDRVLTELFAANSAEEAQRVLRNAAGEAFQQVKAPELRFRGYLTPVCQLDFWT